APRVAERKTEALGLEVRARRPGREADKQLLHARGKGNDGAHGRQLGEKRPGAGLRRPPQCGNRLGLAGTLPAATPVAAAALSASPQRWLGDSPWVQGTRPYRAVPPLPVLSSLNPDPLLSAVAGV